MKYIPWVSAGIGTYVGYLVAVDFRKKKVVNMLNKASQEYSKTEAHDLNLNVDIATMMEELNKVMKNSKTENLDLMQCLATRNIKEIEKNYRLLKLKEKRESNIYQEALKSQKNQEKH